MKITFVNPIGACGAYRSVFPGMELRERGHTVTFVRKDNLVGPEMMNADIVVFQRVSHQGNVNCLLDAKRYAKVVHEVDDNFHDLPPTNLAHGLYGPGALGTKATEKACQGADAVTTATQSLADRYRRFNPNTVACPNAIPDSAYRIYRKRSLLGGSRRPGQVRIGWAGAGDYHQADIALIVEPMTRILRENQQVRLVLFGGEKWPQFPGLEDRVETYPALQLPDTSGVSDEAHALSIAAGIERYYRALNDVDLDIGLAPLENIVFNETGKSDLKLLEYGMLGIPSVASRWGPYERHAKQPGAFILTASDAAEWEARIRTLLEHPQFRTKVAYDNREHIGRRHLLSQNIGAWESLYESLLEKQEVAS